VATPLKLFCSVVTIFVDLLCIRTLIFLFNMSFSCECLQGLLFILCALCPPDVSKVRVGQLTPYAIETLRNIRDFLDVKFIIKPDPNANTVTLKCVGAGVKNLARKIS
jgi:hypothetical protein